MFLPGRRIFQPPGLRGAEITTPAGDRFKPLPEVLEDLPPPTHPGATVAHHPLQLLARNLALELRGEVAVDEDLRRLAPSSW